MSQKTRTGDRASWLAATWLRALGEQSATMMEAELWLRCGNKIYDVEALIELGGGLFEVQTMTHSHYVREQDVVAIKTV